MFWSNIFIMPVCVHVCAYDDFRKLTDSLSQLFIVGNENKRLSVLHFLNHNNTVLTQCYLFIWVPIY